MSAVADNRGERRYELIAASVVIVLAVGTALGNKLWRRLQPRPEQQQCEQLVDRYIEQASRQLHPDADEQAIKRAVAASARQATRNRDVQACRRDLSAEQVGCGLRAPNIDEMERCLQ